MGNQKRQGRDAIGAKLCQVDVMTGQGKAMAEAIRAMAVTEPSNHRWSAECSALNLDQV